MVGWLVGLSVIILHIRAGSCTSMLLSDSFNGVPPCRFPRLEILLLQNCKSLTEAGLLAILNTSGQSLRRLDLSGTKLTLSSAAAGDLSCSFPRLRYRMSKFPWPIS